MFLLVFRVPYFLSLFCLLRVLCTCLSVVVTYKKRSKASTSWEAATHSGGVGDDTEKDEELTSGQFGITDPEDEGKDWLDCGGKTRYSGFN